VAGGSGTASGAERAMSARQPKSRLRVTMATTGLHAAAARFNSDNVCAAVSVEF
jgi:hypothetical protein